MHISHVRLAVRIVCGATNHANPDVSVYNVIWSEIEPNASIVAACLPNFGPLIKSGLSLQSLARSFQSHIFKRSTTSSSDSEHLASSGWPAL